MRPGTRGVRLTLLLQVHAAFCDYDGHIAVDVALPVLVEQRYGDVRVRYALDEGYAKYTCCGLCVSQ
jgi:hypothetical protein